MLVQTGRYMPDSGLTFSAGDDRVTEVINSVACNPIDH